MEEGDKGGRKVKTITHIGEEVDFGVEFNRHPLLSHC